MEIRNYRNINEGCLKSAFTVFIPEWGEQEIDCTYFEKGDGNHWVNFAALQYMSKEGKKKSYNQTRFSKETTERLVRAIKEKIKTGQVIHKTPPPPPPPKNNDTVQGFSANEELPF